MPHRLPSTERLIPDGRATRFEGNERFELGHLLGAGGMGEVFEAFDHTLGAPVAVKRLPRMSADALLHFKREFRVIADLSHPNLIQLGELFSDRDQWFFTMELVRGVDFLTWVRTEPAPPLAGDPTQPDGSSPPRSGERSGPSGRLDEPHLRGALGQLVTLLAWLHELGRVHLDLKPSNILVTADGRLVLLDFGIAADLGAGDRPMSAGTVLYAAPEQLSGAPITSAADQYALGVMLYQALTGHLPFDGQAADVMHAKLVGSLIPPLLLEPATPGDLDRMCVALLSRSPSQRPTARALSSELGGSLDAAGPAGLPFAGRGVELAALDRCLAEACAGKARVALIVGEGGVGKSSLLRQFLDRVRLSRRDCLVLSSVCHEQESVPFKAFDELMDRVARVLADAPKEAIDLLSASARALLGRAFPVLATGGPFADAATADLVDPHELRARLRQGLIALFRWLGRDNPLVVLIDDLHWSDDDSLELLEGLVAALEDTPALILLTQRPDARTPRLPGDAVRIALEGLPQDEATTLVAGLLHGASAEARVAIATAVRDSGGNPLLLDALVRHALACGPSPTGRLEDAIGARVEALPPRARELLALVATGAGTVSQRAIARALGGTEGLELGRLVALLRQERLLCTRGGAPGDALDTYHDRIRAAVLGARSEPDLRRDHARLAAALEQEPAALVDRETLAQHWLGAGQPERARGYLVEAAEGSMTALAFERAARLFASARPLFLDDPARTSSLSRRLGDALSAMGRGSDAADAYLEARAAADPTARLLLERLAASALVRSGHFARAAELHDRALAAVSEPVPRTRTAVVLGFLLERARIRLAALERADRPAAAQPTARLEVLWTASTGLAFADPVRAAFYQSRFIRHALAEGPPAWQARALALEATFRAAFGGQSSGRVPTLLHRAAILARSDAHATGFVELATANAEMHAGSWQASERAADRAEALLRDRCTGVEWELSTLQYVRLWILLALGRIRDLSALHDRMLAEADERGDRNLEVYARVGSRGLRWLAVDAPDEAYRQVALALAPIRDEAYRHVHFQVLMTRVHVDLYRGDTAQARARMEHDWPLIERAHLMRIQMTGVNAVWTRGRLALAEARGRARRGARATAERASSWLARQPQAYARAMGQMLRAGLLLDQGAPCLDALAEGAAALRASHLPLHAFALERCHAELLADGRARVAALDGQLAAQGVSRPDRIAFMLLPVAARP